MSFFNWTPEICERIAAMWMEGISAGRIAMEICTSRNSVIGKINRMGIERPPGMRLEPAHLAESNKGRKRIETTVKPPTPPKPVLAVVSYVTGDFSERGRCRYIPDDPTKPGWRCCAAPAAVKSYCLEHARVVFAPARKMVNPEGEAACGG